MRYDPTELVLQLNAFVLSYPNAALWSLQSSGKFWGKHGMIQNGGRWLKLGLRKRTVRNGKCAIFFFWGGVRVFRNKREKVRREREFATKCGDKIGDRNFQGETQMKARR